MTAGPFDGFRFQVDASGPRLSELVALGAPEGLPDAPFSVSGQVRLERGAYRIIGAAVRVADHNLTLDGLVDPSPCLAGTAVVAKLNGSDLGDLGRLLAGLVELPELPAKPYTVDGDAAVLADGFDVRFLHGTLGSAMVAVTGRLGVWPELVGTDLGVIVDGPDASLVTALSGITVPAAPFRMHGRSQKHASGARFNDLSLRLGGYRAWLDGTMGKRTEPGAVP